jgi:NADH:ubiquinone oxidoreductase subunit E
MMPAEVCEYPDSKKSPVHLVERARILTPYDALQGLVASDIGKVNSCVVTVFCQAKIDREFEKFPADQNSRRSWLTLAVRVNGWLPNGLMVTEVLALSGYAHSMAGFMKVATFYNMYNKADGQTQAGVYQFTMAASAGGVDAAEYLKHKLSVDWKEIAADGKLAWFEKANA